VRATIRYGKSQVTLYRTYARPLAGLTRIPESAFTGRDNNLFALTLDVEVFGDNFLAAYTHGDNRSVVATDTMKNFILQETVEFEGSTLETLLDFLGRRFLATYPQMQSLRLRGREVPFSPLPVPQAGGAAFGPSDVLFSHARDDAAVAWLDLARDSAGARIVAHQCGREGLQLVKLTGNSFASFQRDAYTTLADAPDRLLYIYLDVYWRYTDVAHAVGPDVSQYVAAEQVRDCVGAVFHEFVSMSIQHLVHEMGQRLLQRYPQLAEVAFEAQNRIWDTAAVSEADPRVKVYCDPRPPYGAIGLTLTRE
jgi:urate oxidase / 2-oxo-4-hydroxy-4-carboxy-5-ureidoimidazoline decarboxylase